MKKFLFSILFALLMCCTFTSCDVDNNTYLGYPFVYGYYWQPNTTNAAGQYAIGGYVNGQTRANTRAAVSSTYDDKFSLFAWTADSTVMNNYHGVFSGNTWGYEEQVKFFDNFVPAYNFIAVIPQDDYTFSNGTVTVPAHTFGVETTDASYTGYDDQEILWASTTVEKANYATGASLTFNHANSKVYLKFTSDDANTQILDYTPYTPANPGSPAIPGTPGTETYTSKSTKFVDELVAGGMAQVCIGFVGASSPKLTTSNPTTLYVGVNNATYNFYAKDWLLSIKDAVNSQFVYYRLDQVSNSTSKTETTEDWESANSNKNIFMMKLASGVNATDFANGNDAFWTALCAHETDWYGGSPAVSFKSVFQKAYDEGWRVIRINESDANSNQVLVFLANNSNTTTQVCEITGGTPDIPAVPATPESGKQGIIVLPATSVLGDGTDAVLSTYPSEATIDITLSGLSWTSTATNNTFTFTKPSGNVYTTEVESPTTWFTFPKAANTVENLGYTVKFSYVYKGVNVYDARVYIPMDKCIWESGKYYTYVINIKGRGNGHDNPNNEDGDDPVITGSDKYEIVVNPAVINGYEEGQKYTFEVK